MPTILVADDNSNIQKMVSLVFKEKGINVVAVGNGEAACRKVPEVRPDVVLADVFMPVRNGYEVCEFVKQDPEFADTPVILLVGAFDPLDEKEAQRVGANGVLKKPFVPPDPLIAMVSSLLKTEETAEAQPASAFEDTSAPESPAETGPTARQLAIASAQAQYRETDEEQAVTTFNAPVAVPSSQGQEIEQDDSEPASEWAKRRETMDYEIDAADSADMVERLAAQGSSEEPEIQAADKHVPFGGAILSGTVDEYVPESSPSAAWSAPETEVSAEPSYSMAPDPEITQEFSPPAPIDEKESSTSPHHEIAPVFDLAEIETSASFLRVPPPPELQPAEEPAAMPGDTVGKASIPAHPFAAAPLAQESIDTHQAHLSDAFESFSKAPAKAPFTEEGSSFSLPSSIENEAIPTAATEIDPYHAAPASAQPNVTSAEAVAQETPSTKPIDPATVDEVVAKVISKLEPQLHQALANGVLRPLVEELLNQQREKK